MYYQITTLTRDGLSLAATSAPLLFANSLQGATVLAVLNFLVVLIFRFLEYQRTRKQQASDAEIALLKARIAALEKGTTRRHRIVRKGG